MKGRVLLIVIIYIAILSGCAKGQEGNKDTKLSSEIKKPSKIPQITKEKIIPISLPDLSTEEGMKEYLLGKWTCEAEYLSSLICEMNVDKYLNVHLLFYDSFTDEPKGEYEGVIKLNRIYASPNEAPDAISIELKDKHYPENEYFLLHRTVYDGKRVMSLFFTGTENSVFNKLADLDDYEYMIEEVMFEKFTGESSKIVPRKDDWFYAVFWGHGVPDESIWIDDVWWTKDEDDDYARVYPSRMTIYESDIPESVLYKIAKDTTFDILADGMEKGEVYYIETDRNGNITELINAEYHDYLARESYSEEIGPEVEEMVMDLITDGFVEIEEYLDMGMTVLFTGETTLIDDEECYNIALGTDHEEHFVAEIHYAVNIYKGAVYRYDVLTDTWEQIGQG